MDFVGPSDGLLHQLRVRLGVGLGVLFLVGPASDLARADLGAARTAGLAFGLALFVCLYLLLLPPAARLVALGSRAVQWALAALAAIPVALLLAGAPTSFAALFVYFVAAAGLVLRPRQAVVVIAATAAGVAVGAALESESVSASASTTLTVLAIGLMMVAFARKIQANRELRDAREELAQLAVSEERLRIARDLHDLLGHSLSVVAVKSELAARLLERDPHGAAAELDDIRAVSRQALGEVREVVQGYRRLALPDALDGAKAALAAAGIDCELEGRADQLPHAVEGVIAWAVREGTTNFVRHSSARACTIRVQADGASAAVEVVDDGDAAPERARGGSGLLGLAERAEKVRGRLEAGARADGRPGFRLRLTVPLAQS
jgi:two-component system sensor histidine kinase DesK